MGKHKTKRKSRKNSVKKGGRDPPDIGLLKSELARQKEETAHYIENLTNENARLEIEKRDCLSQNAELLSENEFLNEENDNLLDENNELKKKEIEA